MANATTPATTPPPDILEGGEYDQFMLRTPAEILVVMRGLYSHVSQMTAFFNEGKDMLITTLAVVADDHLILDYGPSSEMNRKALIAEKHFCVTTLEKVRVQFILRGFSRVEQDGRPAFRCALPTEVLRLQRREYYRLATPIARPLNCMVTIPLPDGSLHGHEAHVFDISGGGLGISAPPESIPFDIDNVFPDCHLELPEVGSINGTLKVKSLFDITMRNGMRIRRAGCEFVKLPGPMMTLIQRYIIKVERERKAREMGMG
ncbi:MAG: flagellar brake protein [Rhodocyclaceae bacterium]|nr:flagellar brake protein [Rhodocyclaceae bacterium]